MEIQIAICVLLLVALTFLSTVDVAFGSLSDVALRRLAGESGELPARRGSALLREIQDDRPRFRFTLGAAIQILQVAVSVLVTSIAFLLLPGSPFVIVAFVAGVALVLLSRQLLPRLLAARDPERTLLLTLPVLQPFYRLLAAPRSTLARRRERRAEARVEAAAPAVEADDADEANEAGIQALIDVGEEEGIIEEQEGELIHTIIEFGDRRVNEVMTPRTEIVALPLTATAREARDLVIESKYSRLPVYREQIDNVVGIIYVRDLLLCWAEGREADAIENLLRPAYFVPETKPIAELLEEMQKTHVQLAMVTDEYGGVEGLVTVEDILEEIVGEIEDEDTEQDEIVEIIESSDGYYDVLGATEIGKIERLFDMEIEDDDFTTIAGLVITELGRVPEGGERLAFRGLEVEVLDADERRINRLRLRRAADADADGAGA